VRRRAFSYRLLFRISEMLPADRRIAARQRHRPHDRDGLAAAAARSGLGRFGGADDTHGPAASWPTFGYRARPCATLLAAYIVFWAGVLVGLRRTGTGRAQVRSA
jgi:hypothetical protein